MGIKERKEREKNQRKAIILETAKDLFFQNGFLNVTMKDIANATELSTGAIYLYFKNKEDIFAGLAALGSQKLDKIVDNVLSKKNVLEEKNIKKFINDYLKIYNEFGCYFDVLLLNYRGRGEVKLSEDYAKAIRELTEQSLFKVVNFFSSSLGKKSVDSDKAINLTLTFWSCLLGMSQLMNLGEKNLIPKEMVENTISTAARLLFDAFEK